MIISKKKLNKMIEDAVQEAIKETNKHREDLNKLSSKKRPRDDFRKVLRYVSKQGGSRRFFKEV